MTVYPRRQSRSTAVRVPAAVYTPVPAPKTVENEAYQAVQFFEQNMNGRDYVIADVHGAFDMVIEGMRQVGFKPAVDRLFCTGDLVDRGEGSYRVLEFLTKPYVFSSKGNHDDKYVALSLDDIRVLGAANFDGMGWVRDVSDERLAAIQKRLSQLPIAMQIKTARGVVGLVHGDVPKGMHWDAFVEALKRGDEKVINVALEGRDRLNQNCDSGVEGIDRVFVGHTVQWDGPRRLGNVFAIDTGAVFRESHDMGALTMVNMNCCTSIFAPSSPKEPTPSLIIHAEEALGDYSELAALRQVMR